MVMQLHYRTCFPIFLYRWPPVSLDAESTLMDRYQTTVPETVRRALGLGKRDKTRRLQALVAGVEVDLGAPLRANDE